MNTSTMRIAVAGATGRVGHHVVDVLGERGHDAVAISRSNGVNVITGEGLAEALAGVDVVIDVATGPSPDQAEATAFFVTAANNLHAVGADAGVQRMLVVSIVGTDRFVGGYGAAKIEHERAALSGPIPTQILRATQFHEFVPLLLDWGRQGEVAYVPKMRTQPVAARAVAEALVELALDPDADGGASIPEIAGPREERLVELARLYAERRGDPVRVEEGSDPDNPDREINESGGLLPGPGATIAGPSFEEWVESES
jgi:uncharacterized protein YbjT (DUF2867 family)